jgi:uncharacterized protein YecE (DUF72 family)
MSIRPPMIVDPPPLIGTAGWSIPKDVATTFPAEGTHLGRYAGRMAAAEINSSFHRPHRRTTYERWAAATPDAFRFSVKLPRQISHVRRLVDVEDALDAFIDQAGGLGEKLSVILLQLPPSLAFDRAVAAAFLAQLRRRIGDTIGIACEPRHASWFEDAADGCLADHGVARAVADPVLAPGGDRPGGWTGLHYFRLHGSPRVYYSAYSAAQLQAFAAAIGRADGAPGQRWCIFDNTAAGAALSDAMALQALLTAADG